MFKSFERLGSDQLIAALRQVGIPLLSLLPFLPVPCRAAPEPLVTATLCGALEAAAARNDLPAAFFTRLIWQESRFDPAARSPVGAEGVAQFMPGTAAERGLLDPFEPARALDESAAYLKELRQRFGNLGLAAAAYNAGPGRVGRWLAGTAGLPQETIDYVGIVTGRPVFEWRGTPPPSLDPEPGFSCLAFAGDAGRRRAPAATSADEAGLPPPKAWAVILVASFNRVALTAEVAVARAKLARVFDAPAPATKAVDAVAGPPPDPPVPVVRRRHLGGEPAKKYVVQIETDDRAAGNRMCKRLEANGGNCIVLRNLLR